MISVNNNNCKATSVLTQHNNMRNDSDHFLLVGWRVAEEKAKWSEQDVHHADDGHEPWEANTACDSSTGWWACTAKHTRLFSCNDIPWSALFIWYHSNWPMRTILYWLKNSVSYFFLRLQLHYVMLWNVSYTLYKRSIRYKQFPHHPLLFSLSWS